MGRHCIGSNESWLTALYTRRAAPANCSACRRVRFDCRQVSDAVFVPQYLYLPALEEIGAEHLHQNPFRILQPRAVLEADVDGVREWVSIDPSEPGHPVRDAGHWVPVDVFYRCACGVIHRSRGGRFTKLFRIAPVLRSYRGRRFRLALATVYRRRCCGWVTLTSLPVCLSMTTRSPSGA